MIGLLILCLSFGACKRDHDLFPGQINRVKHVVVIYLENRSFDNLYGKFPGANGLSNANVANITQVDLAGQPYTFLPPVPGTNAFPTNLPNINSAAAKDAWKPAACVKVVFSDNG